MEVELEETIKRSKSQAKRFNQLVTEKLNEKPRIRKTEPKEKTDAVSVDTLIDTFKGTLVTDKEVVEYINFRYPGTKRILFYCIGRKNFITVSTHDDSMASGWKSQRLVTHNDLKNFVESIKEQVGGEN